MTLVGPCSTNRQMGCGMSMGPKKLGVGRGVFLWWSGKWSTQNVDAEGDEFSCTVSKSAVFAPCGVGRRLPHFGLWCFLSFYCINSPKIHLNITFSLGLNQVMNNKSKQQLPSTVPVKFHVLILRDCDWFFHSFSLVLYEMWLDIWSLSAAQLPAWQTGMGQW